MTDDLPMTDTDQNNPFAAIAKRIDANTTYVRHWPLTGGVSAQIDAIELALTNGGRRQVVVRRHGAADWKPLDDNVTASEFALQSTLFTLGLPVPEPLMLDVSGTVLPSPYLVMGLVQGTTEVEDGQLTDALHKMVGFLLRLHALDTNTLDLKLLTSGDDPVQGALQYIPDTPSHAALRSAVTLKKAAPPGNTLLHGDFWPGNIIWRDGEIVAVIDWEDAAIGSAVSDVAGSRSEIMAIYGESALQTFTECYLASSNHDMADLPLWDIYAGYAALGTMADWGLDPSVEALRRARTQLFVDNAAQELLQGM